MGDSVLLVGVEPSKSSETESLLWSRNCCSGSRRPLLAQMSPDKCSVCLLP